MTNVINPIEIGKELLKTKVMAKFSHYSEGKLFYRVAVSDGIYQFPISTIEKGPKFPMNDSFDGSPLADYETIQLSQDLGKTNFYAEIRGSDLFRWIKTAIKNEDFMLVGR